LLVERVDVGIVDPRGREPNGRIRYFDVTEACLFCKIVAGELPCERVDEDEHTVAFMDISPWTRGHALVIPRNHARDLYEIDAEGLRHTMVSVQRLALRMRERLGCEGVNVFSSCEAAAGQTVFHLHIHVLPRFAGDAIRLPGKPREPERDELAVVAAELRG